MWKHVETCGNMWKHVETCGNIFKKLLSSGCIWQSDVPPWRFMALSLTRSFSHVLLSVFQPRCFCASARRWDFSFTRCGMTRCLDPKILDHRPERTTSCSFESSELTREVEKNGREKWRKSDSGHLQEHVCAPISIHISIHRESMDFYDSSTTLLRLYGLFGLTSIGSIELRIDASMCREANIFFQRSESLDSTRD